MINNYTASRLKQYNLKEMIYHTKNINLSEKNKEELLSLCYGFKGQYVKLRELYMEQGLENSFLKRRVELLENDLEYYKKKFNKKWETRVDNRKVKKELRSQ